MEGGSTSVSVIVTSHQRSEWLLRCLDAVSQLRFPLFEVVVVADGPSLDFLADRLDATRLKTVRFDLPSLAKARNAGIAASAGNICAFLDDDAVPEPMWLEHLVQPFEQLGADAAVGFVRGRNGISFQSCVGAVDREAETHRLRFDGDQPGIPQIATGRALKLVGTNMAVRRDKLLTLGFDPDFDFFLDDSDLSMRLAGHGAKMAVSPLAEVHHAFAPSARRTTLRRPRRLYDVGKSTALYLRKHGAVDIDELHDRLVRRERTRLERHMVMGTCEPRDVGRILADLETGWRDGIAQILSQPEGIKSAAQPFLRFETAPAGHTVLASRFLRRRATLHEAARIARERRSVSVFSFSLTPVRHHVRFENGVWRQTGGQFGRSTRGGPTFRWNSFGKRLRIEMDRVAKQRGIGEIDLGRDTEEQQ